MTATVPAAPVGSELHRALGALRLRGAIFLRGEYSPPWAVESFSGTLLAQMFAGAAERVIYFHVIAAGRCWVEVDGGERHWARAGDVVVLPYGDTHRMGGAQDAVVVAATTLLGPMPWPDVPLLRHGGAGRETTSIVCGYLASDDPLFDPGLRALPRVMVVRPVGPALQFVQASIHYAMLQTTRVADRVEVSTEVPRLLLVEILKIHLASAPAAHRGWLTALHDPVLAPAMAAAHADPGRKWSVADLAAVSVVSPSVLDARFRDVLGLPPIRYLSAWRMHLAREFLEATDLGVATVAHRVGYASEEAFSRAFSRHHGTAPAAWRRRSAGRAGARPAGLPPGGGDGGSPVVPASSARSGTDGPVTSRPSGPVHPT
ncbi:AraC family transcriptional regulator [Blastococcus sp. URHD0036]|uniref:AraC family transcriptional regulator n=1 Tax=Blastococcus sp. URHD0036 TaxID=1380356 RepID=UPI0009DF57D6|nr:AraC family transcriptional regulator [Blastococcus sp. URHD0036]